MSYPQLSSKREPRRLRQQHRLLWGRKAKGRFINVAAGFGLRGLDKGKIVTCRSPRNLKGCAYRLWE